MRVIVRRRTSIEARVLILYDPKYLRDVCSHLLRRGGAAVARLQSHALRLLQPRRPLHPPPSKFHARQLRRASQLQRLQHGTAGEEVIARTLQRRHVQPGAQGFKLLQACRRLQSTSASTLLAIAASRAAVPSWKPAGVSPITALTKMVFVPAMTSATLASLNDSADTSRVRLFPRVSSRRVVGRGCDRRRRCRTFPRRARTRTVEAVALDDRRQRHQLSLNFRDQQL